MEQRVTADGLERLSIDDVDLLNECLDAWHEAEVRAMKRAEGK